MARQYFRLLKFSPLIILIPILWTAHSSYTFESYLNSLAIRFQDFPQSYVEALIKATTANQGGFDFDYAIFPTNAANNASASTNTIPPLIHFIWFENLYDDNETSAPSQIPSHGSHAPARCALFNPSYTITTWNASAAEAFLTEHYPTILPTYTSYPYPIQRVDLLKYFLLLHYGGLYMDLDISCRRPMEPLMQFPAWLPKASPLGVNNDLMAARPGHPLLEYMTSRLEGRNRRLGSEWATVFWSTGPKFASDMVREWVEAHREGRYVKGESKDADADPDAFYTLPEQFYSQDPGYTFFGHSPGGTWYGDDAKFVVWLLDRPWIIAIIVGSPVALWAALAIRKRGAQGWRTAKMQG